MTESRIARRCRTIRRDSDNPGAGKPTGDARHPLRQAIGGWTAEPAGPTQKATTGPFLHCRSPGPYRNFGMRGPVSVRVGMKGRRAQHIAPRPSGAGFGSSCTRADAPRPAGPCAPRRAPRSRPTPGSTLVSMHILSFGLKVARCHLESLPRWVLMLSRSYGPTAWSSSCPRSSVAVTVAAPGHARAGIGGACAAGRSKASQARIFIY